MIQPLKYEDMTGHTVYYHGTKTEHHGRYIVDSVWSGPRKLTLRRLMGNRHLYHVDPSNVTPTDMNEYHGS